MDAIRSIFVYPYLLLLTLSLTQADTQTNRPLLLNSKDFSLTGDKQTQKANGNNKEKG